MSDKNRKSSQFIPSWPNSHAPKATPESTKTSSIHEESLELVSFNDLQQGELYIIKIKLIAIALFQGWDDEMCCFSILRTDLLEDLRWSEARYLPENFDAYLAFDYAGNPPIHLWTKHLRAVIPINWFNIFEEARHMQRQWNVTFWDPPSIVSESNNRRFYNLIDTTVPENDEESALDEVIHTETKTEQNDDDQQCDEDDYLQDGTVIGNEVALKENRYYTSQQKVLPATSLLLSESPISDVPADKTTPAMRLQNQYNIKSAVTQQPEKDLKQLQQQKQQQQQQTNDSTIDSASIVVRPEIKQRRSFTSFFLKKKKSKKSLNGTEDSTTKKDTKRKSAPTTPTLNEKHYTKPSAIELSDTFEKLTRELSKENKTPVLTASASSSTKNHGSSSSSPSPILKTPKNEEVTNDVKVELFDIDSYFDMQATFAFLNSSKTDTFALMDNKKASVTN
ncbi:uncharacterized protein EV154DRAFT_518040 [Mucor mucedo]|uniref:uncharacterized protein n=1 Tax=Mucor mucedo TaxID=29922 RepID=UPI00221F0C24|nr:uncharacterized protein EV154DRAFT_518040 [Mucor mucedo]KAI7888363.1 hypothetical protein EV154DRAFT_518040 [Mucor mucedo]